MKTIQRISIASILLMLALGIAGQSDPDPNSPIPVLVSGKDAERALVVSGQDKGSAVRRSDDVIFSPSRTSRLTVFVNGLDLSADEGKNSVRLLLKQRSGKTFELEVLELRENAKNQHALVFRLHDPAGFRGQPIADGDSLIYLTWRGNSSNQLKIALGSTGGMEIPAFTKQYRSEEASTELVGYRFSGDRKRFSEQATFGPSAMLDNRLRRIGIRTWLADQFTAPYPTIPYPDPPQSATVPPANCTSVSFPACFRERYTMIPLQTWFFKEALYGEAQLRHKTAWALGQIWVTSGVSVQQSSHAIANHKVLSSNAFGNYRTLMGDMTLNPAMGHYLDMAISTRQNPNENYPREILQLFSIGLYMLNPDGTLLLDNNGQPIPTYTQETINELSKVLTGWSFCNITCANSTPSIVNYKDPMILTPANHDLSAKTLLQYPNAPHSFIAACTDCTTDARIREYAKESLDTALDNIFHHPNVGPFIGKLLIQHLVTSDPSPAYIQRVTAAFNGNNTGARGEMKDVLRAILLDPEARGDMKTDPRYGKLREPVQLITNLGRQFPASDFIREGPSDGALSSYSTIMGQNPFNSPTVFNYFSPDYIVPGTTILAPEFEILNTSTATKRTNFLHTLIFDGVTPNATDSLRGTNLDFREVIPAAEADPTGNMLADALSTKMLHGTMSQIQRNAILSAISVIPDSNPIQRTRTAVYVVSVSSAYQVQR
jgi:Uncharacterized protein conserved in bacteria